jgi:hypothetical protein
MALQTTSDLPALPVSLAPSEDERYDEPVFHLFFRFVLFVQTACANY